MAHELENESAYIDEGLSDHAVAENCDGSGSHFCFIVVGCEFDVCVSIL